MGTKLGVLIPTREQILNDTDDAGALLRWADAAEDLAFDSVWVGDSTIARPRHEPLTLLSAVAGRTRRVSLGTAVMVVPQRNPLSFAHQIATLDQISEGRVVLGVGFGIGSEPVKAEFEAMGAPFEKRIGRMLESLRLCQGLWTGEPVTWDGRWTLNDAVLRPRPAQTGGPPIWGGGSAPGSLRRAGRHFDGWMPTGPAEPHVWAERWQTVCDAATDAGRDSSELTGALYLTATIAPTKAKGEERLMDYLRAYYGPVAERMRANEACYAGPVEGLGEWVQGFVDSGVQHLVIRFAGDHELQMQAMARCRADLNW